MKQRRPPRDKATILEAIKNVATLVNEGSKLQDALDRYRINGTTWKRYRPEGTQMRRTSAEVDKAAMRVHALVRNGVSIEEATQRIGLKRSVYANAAKRLNLSPPGATVGSVRADMLPPRPGGKGGKRTPKPVDMNSVESLAKRMSKIDKLLHGVNDLKAERKKIAGRLRSLLKV